MKSVQICDLPATRATGKPVEEVVVVLVITEIFEVLEVGTTVPTQRFFCWPALDGFLCRLGCGRLLGRGLSCLGDLLSGGALDHRTARAGSPRFLDGDGNFLGSGYQTAARAAVTTVDMSIKAAGFEALQFGLGAAWATKRHGVTPANSWVEKAGNYGRFSANFGASWPQKAHSYTTETQYVVVGRNKTTRYGGCFLVVRVRIPPSPPRI